MSLHPSDFDHGAVHERRTFIQEVEDLYEKALAQELWSSAIRAKALSARLRGFLSPPLKGPSKSKSSNPDPANPFANWDTETLNAFLEALERSSSHDSDPSPHS